MPRFQTKPDLTIHFIGSLHHITSEGVVRILVRGQETERRFFVKRIIGLIGFAVGGFLGIYGLISLVRKPKDEKTFDSRTSTTNRIGKLPKPRSDSDLSIEYALKVRRSIRDYSGEPLTLEDVSQLLWAAQGITDTEYGLRTAPSAGGTYPLDVYLVIKDGGVEGLDAGVYKYTNIDHSIFNVLNVDKTHELMEAGLGQEWIGAAAINLVITAVYTKTTTRYGERGVRYVHMEAGHVSQNIYLQAESLGLGTVVIGAFYDEQVKQAIGAGQNDEPLYILPIGRKR